MFCMQRLYMLRPNVIKILRNSSSICGSPRSNINMKPMLRLLESLLAVDMINLRPMNRM